MSISMTVSRQCRVQVIGGGQLRVGIDVGGTNTDAVLMGARRVLAVCSPRRRC